MLRQRFCVRFRKEGLLRFVGHGDLMRCFERALRRSGLPLKMSEGFNPHPRLSFPAPLAVGLEGEREVMEFELADWVSAGEVRARLAAQLPEGLALVSVELAPPSGKAQAEEAEYVAEPAPGEGGEPPLVTAAAAEALMQREEIWAERPRKDKVKRDNIRPFLRDVSVEEDSGRVRMRIAVSPAGSARPDEVLAALGVPREAVLGAFRVRRTEVRLRG